MKILKTITTSIFISLSILSCSSDDDSSNENNEPEPNISEQKITIEDTDYPVDKGLFEDYGTNYDSPNFYNADFFISNGELVNSTEDGTDFIEFDEESEVIFYSELFSFSSESFEPGTFEITDNLSSSLGEEISFANETYIDLIDQDGNEITYDATSGSVTVSMNSEDNYTVVVDAEFQKTIDYSEVDTTGDDINISFSFTGNFTYSDQRDQ